MGQQQRRSRTARPPSLAESSVESSTISWSRQRRRPNNSLGKATIRFIQLHCRCVLDDDCVRCVGCRRCAYACILVFVHSVSRMYVCKHVGLHLCMYENTCICVTVTQQGSSGGVGSYLACV